MHRLCDDAASMPENYIIYRTSPRTLTELTQIPDLPDDVAKVLGDAVVVE